MKLLLAFVAVALVVADTSQDDQHYNALSTMVDKDSEVLQSAMLTEVGAHVALKNPMQTIYDTVQNMLKEIRADRKKAMKVEKADRKMCSDTIKKYSDEADSQSKQQQEHLKAAGRLYSEHSKDWGIPNQKNASRAAMNASIATQEVEVARGQKNRDAAKAEFDKLKQAFEYALGNISLIGRVLNGEGTLGDLHGAAGFLEEASCSARMAQLAEANKDVPVVANMLQVFSKSFEKVEASPAKIGGAKGTQAKTQSNSGDMTAINIILAKVRENLVKSLQVAQKLENQAITLWKSEKQTRRKKINDDHISNWKNLEEQGKVEENIGKKWQEEGDHRIKAAKHLKIHDENTILKQFLSVRCKKSRRAYVVDMQNKNNEIIALSKVILYLKTHVFGKNGWSKNIMDVVSAPYKFKVEDPVYAAAKGFSAIDHQSDPVTCKQPYRTVFSKVRILTEDRTNAKYLDPNDLTHSKNMDIKGNAALKGDPTCQLFPSGIPVARANSCSDTEYTHAELDLSGSGFKFGVAAKKMFQIIGRKTAGSKVTFSKGDAKVEIKIKGRCGDAYADDAALDDIDYRSDPIPLLGTGLGK